MTALASLEDRIHAARIESQARFDRTGLPRLGGRLREVWIDGYPFVTGAAVLWEEPRPRSLSTPAGDAFPVSPAGVTTNVPPGTPMQPLSPSGSPGGTH